MGSESQEAWLLIAARSRLGALCLILAAVLAETLIVEPIWHPRARDVAFAAPMWIASVLAFGLMLFGTMVPVAFKTEPHARPENSNLIQTTQPWFLRPMFQNLLLNISLCITSGTVAWIVSPPSLFQLVYILVLIGQVGILIGVNIIMARIRKAG